MTDPHQDKLLQNAFHFAAIGMALVGLDGRWLRVNRSLCGLLGYSEAELLGGSFQDITHPDDLYLDLGYVKQILQGAIATYQMEKRYLHKAGHVIWALLEVALVRDGGGEPQVFISQITDITERKRSERELEHVLEEQGKRLAELEERKRRMDEFRSQLFSVCAWTKRIFYDGHWMSMDHFLRHYLELRLSHGISEEALRQELANLEKSAGDEISRAQRED